MTSILEKPQPESLESGIILQNPLTDAWALKTSDDRVICFAGTDEGLNYGPQQDSLAVKAGQDEQSGKKWLAFVLGDGVSGQPNGDLASQCLTRSFKQNVTGESDFMSFHTLTHQ